jgi:molybdopterin molybdotransferase
MKEFIGFREALDLTLSNVSVADSETLPLHELTGKILSEEILARVDCPSISTSRKDGFAVIATDLTEAGKKNPVTLNIIGSSTAGGASHLKISKGQTVRITTGAPLPDGADAILSEEFCRQENNKIIAINTAEQGRNIHQQGSDIRQGETLAGKGERLTPPLIGLLAAAGLDTAPVNKHPKVAVIATGDEVVSPGEPLPQGKLYASNMIEICSWLSLMRLNYATELVPDSRADIKSAVIKHLPHADVFLTSGGAWGSERDLILEIVESLNWQGIYHRVRMGPGKPVGFGLLEKKPFFCLPGGPPSNEMAFIQLSIPALLKIKGAQPDPFPGVRACLSETVYGKKDWTDFIHARLEKKGHQLLVHPARLNSMLKSMARKEALIILPEDREELPAGEMIDIQLLKPPAGISDSGLIG